MVKKNVVKEAGDGVIVEAKQEYTRQLCNILKPVVYESIFNTYTEVVTKTENINDILIEFQDALTQIPKWNSDVISEHVDMVTESCSFFNDLLSVVFLSNVRILTAVRMNQSGRKKIKIVVPSNEKFVHEVFKNVAKNIYHDPYLFSMKKYNGNVTNNIREVFEVIDVTIQDTIRGLLPFQNIIESYINQTNEDEEDDPITPDGGDMEDSEDRDPIEDGVRLLDDLPVDETHKEDNDPLMDDEPLLDGEGARTDSEHRDKDTLMENFFGNPEQEPEQETLRNIPIGKQTDSDTVKTPASAPPRFFDDEDVPDPK